MKKITDRLVALDSVLTGKSLKQCAQTAAQLQSIDSFFWGAEYYLSDGGYSRLSINIIDNRVIVTSNSLDLVKENWKRTDVQRLVTELKTVLGEYKRELEEEL